MKRAKTFGSLVFGTKIISVDMSGQQPANSAFLPAWVWDGQYAYYQRTMSRKRRRSDRNLAKGGMLNAYRIIQDLTFQKTFCKNPRGAD